MDSIINFILLLLAIANVGQAINITYQDVVKTNKPITVPYGRKVFLNRKDHFDLQVSTGDRCAVKVIQDDRSPGRLHPSDFACKYDPESVYYVHYGGINPRFDRVNLLIRYDTPEDTVIIPVTLDVEVTLQRLKVVDENNALKVDKLLGESDPIDAKVLSFKYGSDETCNVSSSSAQADLRRLPRFGKMVNFDADEYMDCDRLLASGIKYRHTDPDSSDVDHLPFNVKITDKSGRITAEENFQITVKILEGKGNTPPRTSFSSLLLMDVDQYIMTAITPSILSAEDKESLNEDLVYNITSELGPDSGHIVTTDDRTRPITSFYQKDVNDLKIAYNPPKTDSDKKRIIEVPIEVIDDEGMTSGPFKLTIVVNPMNTLSPMATRNDGIQLFEGQSRRLTTSKNLAISDEDNVDDVYLRLGGGLRHGQLLKIDRPVNRVTYVDLQKGLVSYQHDGSDTYTDNIIFKMSDGKHQVEFLFPITIFPEDDRPPVMVVNTEATVQEAGDVEITRDVLSAVDIDDEDFDVVYILGPSYKSEGRLLLRQKAVPQSPQNWTYDDGTYERSIDVRWFQSDIDDGRLVYRHTGGGHVTRPKTDQINFQISDGNEPPNVSQYHKLTVRIMPVDDSPPELWPSVPLQTTVREYETKPITKKELRYTDVDTDDRRLRYKITSKPADTNMADKLEPGKIVLTDDPDFEVDEFTQAQIDHLKISYRPPAMELGIIPRIVQFEFQVEDDSGNVRPNQTFHILVEPVDNKPPLVKNKGIDVFENGLVVIANDTLDVSDPDTDRGNIRFVVTEMPRHGSLRRTASLEMTAGDYFTVKDIEERLVSYVQNGDEEISDRFGLYATDGVHHVPVVVKVNIKPVDDQAPMILASGSMEINIEVDEGGRTRLTSSMIRATDPDSKDEDVVFVVKGTPSEGIIENNGQPTDRFKQQDVNRGRIGYVHTKGEIGLSSVQDEFNLTVSDLSTLTVNGSKIDHVTIKVTINPVDSIAPVTTVNDPLVVNESEQSTITSNHISATDRDSEVGKISCTIIGQTSHGYVENIAPRPGSEKSGYGIPISAFTIEDVASRTINYVQSIHSGIEPVDDRFTFQCSDGVNASPKSELRIQIVPKNDEPPKLFVRDFIVDEGGHLVIDIPILNVEDIDVPKDDLEFRIVERPKFGRILSTKDAAVPSIGNFSFDSIDNGSDIFYEHDGSETTKDSFVLNVTDGSHHVTKVITIRVKPVDDETPRMIINKGLDIEIMDSVVVTNTVLMAQDVDSEDGNLVYVIRKSPHHGSLVLLDVPSGQPTINLTTGMNFTQRDIDERMIEYRNTDDYGIRDLIKFDVTDGSNDLIDVYFYISVTGIDLNYPDVVNKGVELPEGGKVALTTDILSTSDLDSPDENLQFIVSRSPDKGHLESTDGIGTPVTSFTQLDLAGNKIYYVHTSRDEIKMDSFEFEVTDGRNSVYRTFRVTISDVDNKRPVVFKTAVRVKEGGTAYLTPFEINVQDKDTEDDGLKFSVTQLPAHGRILYNRHKSVNVFTMDDVNDNLMTYLHDGTDTTHDSFSFVVTDGTHHDFFVYPEMDKPTDVPLTMDIVVTPIDNALPQIVANTGSSSVSPLDHQEIPILFGRSGFRFTERTLKVEDRDSPDEDLMYVLNSRPKHGFIMHLDYGNSSVLNFTQGDINDMKLYYVLYDDVNATADKFYFNVVDPGQNILRNKSFSINWASIGLSVDSMTVNETEDYLKVKLQRRGYLGETSFVGLSTKDHTAKLGVDFGGDYAKQVQFNPGQREAEWKVKILQDDLFEGIEKFEVILENPIMAVTENPTVAVITIQDTEDVSVVNIVGAKYAAEERKGEISIPIHRTGDLSQEMTVVCSTFGGTATGTVPSTVQSYSDYISRPEDRSSVLKFEPGQNRQECKITIIDDSLYEEDEEFLIRLSSTVGGIIGERNDSLVTILSDPNDVPAFRFGKDRLIVDESVGHVEVMVWRSGTDLSRPSSVTVRSKPSDPKSAQVGYDYVGVGQNLDFLPGVTLQTFKVMILDDLGQPRLEGLETFELVLRMPVNGSVEDPRKAIIVINDTISDLPVMFFKQAHYHGYENEGQIVTNIKRRGDISHESSVRCYTRQNSALVDVDYFERPDSNASIIKFEPGESEKPCILQLKNDSYHEPDEHLRLVLGSPNSATAGKALVGNPSYANISINDDSDRSIIMFEKKRYNVREPKTPKDTRILRIPILRKGDLSRASLVRVHTKDGSAKSGSDYFGFSKEFEFEPNSSRKMAEIPILYDFIKENRETLTIHLKSDETSFSQIKNKKAIIYIQEADVIADVTFPTPPIVISLRDYDLSESANIETLPGYPLICVTPCDPKHPDFPKTGDLCKKEGINNTFTEYRWKVAASTGSDGIWSDFKDLNAVTFFTNPKGITLDSIYFNAGSRVRCAARAVDNDGNPGIELLSPIATISKKDGVCTPRITGSYGAEPFTAKIRYTGSSDPDHPNKLKLTVFIPHRDGLLPIISTRPISNIALTISPDGHRIGNHRCSNLLDFEEISTEEGFITNQTKDANVIGEIEPYQFSEELRSPATLRFYKNLNLEDCTWKFVSYYDVSELITDCGGTIRTDGEVMNLVQSYVSIIVPLHVSYAFYSPLTPGGWQHNDLESDLRVTFVYDTAIMWQQGISAPEESKLQGYLYPKSMKINGDGRLVVNFKTKARFRGQFVLNHPGLDKISSVSCINHPDLSSTLKLLRDEPTYSRPEQEWQFVSDYAIRDYSGNYLITLIPCTVAEDIKYKTQGDCNPRDTVSFNLQVRFQQISDPVPERFSLNTDFFLVRKRLLWLSNQTKVLTTDTDISFTRGDTIYGRIMVERVQSLGNSFGMMIEKCFLCTGVDGYVPKYNPANRDFGCVAKSPNLLYAFKIIDKTSPDSVVKNFRGIPFNAVLAVDDPQDDTHLLLNQPGSDGFHLDSDALFKVSYGRQWFIHCIYIIRSQENSEKHIIKRSTTVKHQYYHAINSLGDYKRQRRAVDDSSGIGDEGKGTNIHQITLEYGRDQKDDPGLLYEIGSTSNDETALTPLWPILVGIILSILVIISVIIISFVLKRRRKDNHLRHPTPLPTRKTYGNGARNGNSRRVVIARDYQPVCSEHTEV